MASYNRQIAIFVEQGKVEEALRALADGVQAYVHMLIKGLEYHSEDEALLVAALDEIKRTIIENSDHPEICKSMAGEAQAIINDAFNKEVVIGLKGDK